MLQHFPRRVLLGNSFLRTLFTSHLQEAAFTYQRLSRDGADKWYRRAGSFNRYSKFAVLRLIFLKFTPRIRLLIFLQFKCQQSKMKLIGGNREILTWAICALESVFVLNPSV